MRVLTMTFVVLVAAFAGCLDNDQTSHGQGTSGGQDNQASLAFQGQGGGTQREQAACDNSGSLSMSWQGMGTVTFTVKDGSGTTIHTDTLGGMGQEADHATLRGDPGTWTLTATRSSDFQGQYASSLSC